MKNQEIKLFIQDEPTLKERFLILMNLLVNNQSESRLESILFFSIFYLQTITGFFSFQTGIFNSEKYTSDNILMNAQKIFRLKEVVMNNKNDFELLIYIFVFIIFFVTCYFIIVLFKTDRNSLYTTKFYITNIIIKFTYYILYNIILDFFSTLLCFGEENNLVIKDYSCSIGDHIIIFIIASIATLYVIFIVLFLQTYYIDAFYLSDNYYAQMSTKYNILMALNSILFSVMKSLIKKITNDIFLIVNFSVGIYLFYFYYQHIIFYDTIINNICGIFHLSYIWTSLFCFIVKHLSISEKGILWFLTNLLVICIYFNIKQKFENWLFCEIPYYKIENINHLLYYLRAIITMINKGLEVQSTKTRLTGIIQLHILECPNPKCLTKTKQKLYLPAKKEWSDRTKPFINDFVFLNNLIVAIMSYFIANNFYSPEMLINFSYYYLEVLGNLCLSINFLHKVELMKMSKQDIFTLERLKIAISNKLIEKLKKENEICNNLSDLNPSYFYKYDFFKRKFYNEIMLDLDLTEQFWKIFSKKENKSIIDFNQVFKISEKIMISKQNVEKLWEKLFNLYSGINEVFDFYCEYVEQINDDSFTKRELESIKRKNETNSDSINQNFYNLIFKNDTGIIICNGDNGKEGLIEKVNLEFEKIFKYNSNELINKDITILMPKIFASQHKEFMQNFINIGEKYIICTKEYYTFAKDKNNSIILIKLYIKIFPVLNDSIYFIGMILPEKIDDLIFIDSNFIIQGMSKKIQDKLKLKNKNFFNENEIPFYMICKNFINFYKIFMKGNKQQINDENNINECSESENNISQSLIMDKEEIKVEEQQENNIEINENIELEYEIKIPNFMMDFQKHTKKDLVVKNIAPETVIIEKSNLIDNTQLINEETLLISKEERNISFNSIENSNKNLISLNNSHPNLISNKSLINVNNTSNKSIVHIPNDNNNNNNNNNNNHLTPNFITPTPNPNNYHLSEKKKNNKIKFQSSLSNNSATVDNIFIQKLSLYKKLFSSNKFTELEEVIENDTKEENTLSYKFNFTFKKHNYKKEKICFVIRCIDNKSELNLNKNDDDSQNNETGKKILSQDNKFDTLKYCFEINSEEKNRINENIDNLDNYLYYDSEFQNTIFKYKEYIKKYSRVHGSQKQNKNNIMDDENASQSSAPGFNSDLSKLNRIFEIRENILKNNKSLNSLNYMFITALFFVFGAGIFSLFFFIIYNNVDKSLNKLDTLQTYFYIVENGLMQIISSLLSLLSLETSIYYNTDNITYQNYLNNPEEYFNSLLIKNINWTDDTTTKLILIQRYFSEFGNADYFWNLINITYPYINTFQGDNEAFPICITKCLVDASTLLHNLNYNQNISSYNNDQLHELIYLRFEAIFNSYDFIIPVLIEDNNYLLDYVVKKNNNKINQVWYLNSIYLVFVCLCFTVYLWQLMITNNYMGEGLEKIVKISQEKIDEMIEKVKTFKEKFMENIEKQNNNNTENIEDDISDSVEEESEGDLIKKKNTKNEEMNKISANVNNNNNPQLKRQESNDFNLDIKKNKKLNLQNTSYVHLTVIFIVCTLSCILLLLISRKVITTNIQIMKVQTYLFGKFASSSCLTVKLKCILLNCTVNNTLNCDSFIRSDLDNIYYSYLSHYPLLNEFYNKYYLLDACGSVFELNSENYINCYNDPLVNLINNTDTFIDMLKEKIENLLYEYESNIKINKNYNPFTLVSSNDYSMMEKIYYVFIIPVIDRLDDIILNSVNDELRKDKRLAIFVIIFLCSSMGIFIIYVKFSFLKKLDYFLNISKCVVKIIPSNMISMNQDLENWLEKMNNQN